MSGGHANQTGTRGGEIAAASRQRPSRLIGLSLIVLLIGMIAITGLSIRAYGKLQLATSQWEAHLVDRAELFNMFAYAANTEANQRNILILRDPSLFPLYEEARTQLQIRLDTIATLPDSGLETRSSLKAIARDYGIELGITDEATALARNGQFEEAIRLVEPAMRRQAPRQIIPAVRRHYALMARQSDILRANLTAAQTAFTRMTLILGTLALLLSALLIWVGRANILRLRRSERMSQRAEAARQQAEDEQNRIEIMMREMNHRVGNSLSMVMSILGMQRARTQNTETRQALKAAQERILSVANAQRRLRFSGDLQSVESREVLASVAQDIRDTNSREDIRLETDFISAMMLDRDAVTLALIMNELVTNAFKHAFPDRDHGVITVTTLIDPNHYFVLRVEDDGVGYPDQDADRTIGQSGLGTSIIDRLAVQFDGTVERGPSKSGGHQTTLTLKALKTIKPDLEL